MTTAASTIEPQADDAPATVESAEPAPTAWGAPPAAVLRSVRFFWFHTPDGHKHTMMDLTGAEAAALEERFECGWGDLRPKGRVAHGMAYLETFLARTDPDHAAVRVAAMSLKEIDEAITVEWDREDDLPDLYEDGLPKATGAP